MSIYFFFFSSRRRHTRWNCDWSSDVCSSDLSSSTMRTLRWRCSRARSGESSLIAASWAAVIAPDMARPPPDRLRLRRRSIPRQPKREARPAPGLALDPDPAAVGLDQVPANDEAEPAPSLDGLPRAGLAELLEEEGLFVGRDAGARVVDRDLDLVAGLGHLDPDRASLRGELERVGEQIHQDLIEAARVRRHPHGGARAP